MKKHQSLEEAFKELIKFDKMEYLFDIFKTPEDVLDFCLINRKKKLSSRLKLMLIESIQEEWKKRLHQKQGEEILKSINWQA
jgi:hypothetical protein